MKITVFCCSPKLETSITLQTIHFLQHMCRDDKFNIQMIGGMNLFSQAHSEAIAEADLVIFASPLMQYGLPSQLMYFMENMIIAAKDIVKYKPFSFYTVSNKLLDETTHKYIRHFFADNGIKLLPTLSLTEKSILEQSGQNELLRWETYIKSLLLASENAAFSIPCNVVLLDVSDGTDNELNSALMKIHGDYIRRGASINLVSLRSFNILSCQSCEACITSRKCILAKSDDFERVNKLIFNNTHIIQLVGTLKHGMLHPLFKAWIDRFRQYGMSPRHTGVIWSYLVNSPSEYSELECFADYISARNGFDGEVFAGVDKLDNYAEQINKTVIAFNTGYAPAETFSATAMRLILQRQAEEYKNVAPNDYKYYSRNGAYSQTMPNPAYAPVYNADSALTFRQTKIMPYQMMINQMMFPGMYNQPMMNGMNSFGQHPVNGMNGFGQPPVNGMNGFGQPPVNGMNGFGQPPVNGMNGFGQPPVNDFGQPPVNDFGQPPVNNTNNYPQ